MLKYDLILQIDIQLGDWNFTKFSLWGKKFQSIIVLILSFQVLNQNTSDRDILIGATKNYLSHCSIRI
jgi:hypothetical protein